MILDDYRTPLNLNSVELYNNLYNDFDSYCFIIIIFIERKLHEKFRYVFFNVFTLIE